MSFNWQGIVLIGKLGCGAFYSFCLYMFVVFFFLSFMEWNNGNHLIECMFKVMFFSMWCILGLEQVCFDMEMFPDYVSFLCFIPYGWWKISNDLNEWLSKLGFECLCIWHAKVMACCVFLLMCIGYILFFIICGNS